MGIEFKLTDRELPASPVFINFLAQWLSGPPFEAEIWADQRSEALSGGDAEPIGSAPNAAELVMSNATGREYVARAYTLLVAMLTGTMAPLEELQSRFHFVNVIGIPRSGGSYLTAELYRAIGMTPAQVPSGIAHDSFPDAGPFQLQPGINSSIMTLKTIAEYLTMVEIFFADRKPYGARIIVPKKLTKFVYAAGLFAGILGQDAEYLLTLRHPVAACVSTYEKSGGLPPDARFSVRSNIEEWCRRDLQRTGFGAEHLQGMDYFEAYLLYWEQFHLALATSGLSASPNLRILAFGNSALQSAAQRYHDRYGSELQASHFHISDTARRRHPDWIERARPAIERIAAVWRAIALPFPAAELESCW